MCFSSLLSLLLLSFSHSWLSFCVSTTLCSIFWIYISFMFFAFDNLYYDWCCCCCSFFYKFFCFCNYYTRTFLASRTPCPSAAKLYVVDGTNYMTSNIGRDGSSLQSFLFLLPCNCCCCCCCSCQFIVRLLV